MIKNNKGITLIALIITIIILLILAMVTIKLVMDQGIFTRAQKAADDYIIAQEQELLSLAYTDYTMAKMGDSNADYTLQNALDNENANATVIEETDDYWLVEFNDTGNQYKLNKENGKIDPVQLGNGGSGETGEDANKERLQVGDYVAYPSCDNYAGVKRNESGISYGDDSSYGWYHSEISSTNGGWRVLSINESTGKIILVSATASTPGNTIDGKLVLKREQVYNNGVELLNRICDTQYTVAGYGKARSITLEDINNAMGVETSQLPYSTLNATFSAQNADHDNSYYPARLAEEQGVEIDSVTTENGISKSESGQSLYLNNDAIYTSTDVNTGLDLGITYKKFSSTLKLQYTDQWIEEVNDNIDSLTNTNETLKEVILGKNETRQWWIATRTISQATWWGHNMADFGMMQMSGTGVVSAQSNYRGQNDTGTNACDYQYSSGVGQIAGWFRPVIEIEAGATINTTKNQDTDGDGVAQDGSFEQPWQLIAA